MYCSKTKRRERSKRCRFERHHKSSSSPARVEDRGKKGYYVPLQRHYFPLSPPHLPKKTSNDPCPHRLYYHATMMKKVMGAMPCEQLPSSPYPAP